MIRYDQLLEAVRQLEPAELSKFQQQVAQLQTSRYYKSLSAEESDLLLKINSVASSQGDRHYQKLLTKRQNETLSESEYQELVVLSDQYEQQNVERVKYLVQLAEIRNISLTDLMEQLEIPQPTYD